MSEIDPREFGMLQANVQQLLESDRLKTKSLADLVDAMNDVRVVLAEARGGWKMFVGVGTAFFTAGGFAWETIRHFFK